MRRLWEGGGEGRLAVDIQRSLDEGESRRLAITTVLTTLDRLADKGIVRRVPAGRANRFFPAMTESEVNQRIVRGVLDDLIAQFPDAVATYFAGQNANEGEGDAEDLRRLAQRVESARASRGSEE